jgi:hypothetical protein
MLTYPTLFTGEMARLSSRSQARVHQFQHLTTEEEEVYYNTNDHRTKDKIDTVPSDILGTGAADFTLQIWNTVDISYISIATSRIFHAGSKEQGRRKKTF